MTSCPAAWGMRWVKPSIATVSPSRTFALTASARDINSDIGASGSLRWLGLFTGRNGAGQMAGLDPAGRSCQGTSPDHDCILLMSDSEHEAANQLAPSLQFERHGAVGVLRL